MPNNTTTGYEIANIAVNAVVFTIKDEKLLVYLSSRDKVPFQDLLELPGGLVLSKETAEDTLNRKVQDVTGVQDVFYQQFFTFTNPGRDPRSRTISVGFLAIIASTKITDFQNFHDISSLTQLAFDHQEIIAKATQFLQQNIDNKFFASQFLPKYFPLNDLQMIYEVVKQQKLDNRNFRKQVLNSDMVEKVPIKQKNVSHRPASLYQFKT